MFNIYIYIKQRKYKVSWCKELKIKTFKVILMINQQGMEKKWVLPPLSWASQTEVRIYKRKQESKNKRKKTRFDQENDKKWKFFLCFLVAFLGDSVFSCFFL